MKIHGTETRADGYRRDRRPFLQEKVLELATYDSDNLVPCDIHTSANKTAKQYSIRNDLRLPPQKKQLCEQ